MKKAIAILLLVIPLLGYAQQDTDKENPDIFADRAADCFANGDEKGGVALLKQGAGKGSSLCCNRLGDYYSEAEDYKAAAKYYRQAGDAEGDFELGGLYLNGNVGKLRGADIKKGLALVRRSERADYRDAIYLVARLFETGVLLEQNQDSAVYMLGRLVVKEDAQALYSMALHCEEGSGVARDSVAAMRYYERAGRAGLGDGFVALGDYYRYGAAGVQPDGAQAYLLYQQAVAADDDNGRGLAAVAECYLEGVGTRVDSLKAVVYLREAVEAGSPRAAALLADMYNYGLAGVQPNGDTALILYQLASSEDDPRGDYMMGLYLYENEAYENALGFVQSAMSHGSQEAEVLYARMLLWGNGVEADPATALPMLRRLASLDPTGAAYYAIGAAYGTGTGVAKDMQQAACYMDTAARMGDARAMLNLGQFYLGGQGVPCDTLTGLEWYWRAVEAGSITATLQIAGSYRQGVVVEKDPAQAVELYQLAADRGSLDALCHLGVAYEQGEGLAVNRRRAYHCYKQAAEAGSVWGMRLMGYCYAQGVYVTVNMEEAAMWFGKAAEAGDAQSCYILAQMYANGEGVKKNRKEARRWLQRASDAGMSSL